MTILTVVLVGLVGFCSSVAGMLILDWPDIRDEMREHNRTFWEVMQTPRRGKKETSNPTQEREHG